MWRRLPDSAPYSAPPPDGQSQCPPDTPRKAVRGEAPKKLFRLRSIGLPKAPCPRCGIPFLPKAPLPHDFPSFRPACCGSSAGQPPHVRYAPGLPCERSSSAAPAPSPSSGHPEADAGMCAGASSCRKRAPPAHGRAGCLLPVTRVLCRNATRTLTAAAGRTPPQSRSPQTPGSAEAGIPHVRSNRRCLPQKNFLRYQTHPAAYRTAPAPQKMSPHCKNSPLFPKHRAFLPKF